MRLTLRIVLAYLNQVLSPEDAQVVAKQIEQDEQTRQLVRRIEEVQRRTSLMTTQREIPTIDPNLVAEYLDNELTPEEVLDIERVTLESDGNLAEVAACYHILTEVLSGVVSPESDLRRRLCALPQLCALSKRGEPLEGQQAATSADTTGFHSTFTDTTSGSSPRTNVSTLTAPESPWSELSLRDLAPAHMTPPVVTSGTTTPATEVSPVESKMKTENASKIGTNTPNAVSKFSTARGNPPMLATPSCSELPRSSAPVPPSAKPATSSLAVPNEKSIPSVSAEKESHEPNVSAEASPSDSHLWMGIPVPPPVRAKEESARPRMSSVESAEKSITNAAQGTATNRLVQENTAGKSLDMAPPSPPRPVSSTQGKMVGESATVSQSTATTKPQSDTTSQISHHTQATVPSKTPPKIHSKEKSSNPISPILWGQRDTESDSTAHSASASASDQTERRPTPPTPSTILPNQSAAAQEAAVSAPASGMTLDVAGVSKPSTAPAASATHIPVPPVIGTTAVTGTSPAGSTVSNTPTAAKSGELGAKSETSRSQAEKPSQTPADRLKDTIEKKPPLAAESTPAFLAHPKPVHVSTPKARKGDMPSFGQASVNAPVFDEPEPLSWKTKLLLSLLGLVMLALGGLGTLLWHQANHGDKPLASRSDKAEVTETTDKNSESSPKTSEVFDNLGQIPDDRKVEQQSKIAESTENSSAPNPSGDNSTPSNATTTTATESNSAATKVPSEEAELPEIASPFGDQNAKTAATDANIDLDTLLGPETDAKTTDTNATNTAVVDAPSTSNTTPTDTVPQNTAVGNTDGTTTDSTKPATSTSDLPEMNPPEVGNRTSTADSSAITSPSENTPAPDTLPTELPTDIPESTSTPAMVGDTASSQLAGSETEKAITATNEVGTGTSKPIQPIRPEKPKVITTPTVPVEEIVPIVPEPAPLPTVDTQPAPADTVPAGTAPVQETPLEQKKIAQLSTPREIMVRVAPEVENMVRISDNMPICSGDRLATLPTYRTTIQISDALVLDSVGESILQMPDIRSSGEGMLRLEYGQFVLKSAPETGLKLRCILGEYRGSLWLANSQTVVAITVTRDVPNTSDPEKTPGCYQVQIACVEGSAAWIPEQQSKIEIGRLRQLSLLSENGTASQVPGALEEMPHWVETMGLTPLEQKASFALENQIRSGSRDLAKTLINIAKYDGKRETQELARRATRTLGVFTYEIDRLDKSQTPEVGIEEADVALKALASGVQRSPELAGQIRTLLEKHFATAGSTIYELLWKYRNLKEPTPNQLVELLNYMSHDKTLIRAAAFYDLMQLYPGDTLNYSPEKREALRASAIAKWARKLKLSN